MPISYYHKTKLIIRQYIKILMDIVMAVSIYKFILNVLFMYV